jgi:MFS family permease
MESALTASAPVADGHDAANKRRLFLICVMAITTTSMAFGLRSSIAGDLKTTLFDPINAAHSAEMLGSALSAVFLTFAITLAVGSPLIDAVGMRTVLFICGGTFLAGTTLIVAADKLAAGESVYTVVWLGMLLHGIGWGCSEAVINPCTTTLYPDDKTHKLNVLHAWWPGGIIIGSLLGLAVGNVGMDWRIKLAVVMAPALILCVLLATTGRFPKTERVAAGIPASEMFMECLKPAFFIWFFAMFLTSAAELAPGQWVDFALTRTIGMKGIWLLIYVSGLMFVMRHFAGTVVHKLSSVGLLWVSCLLAALGLVALSVADSPIMGFLAATIWGIGVCYMWPTMLAAASERFPKSGALGMGLIGTAGSLSIWFLLPVMGKLYDTKKVEVAGGQEAYAKLTAAGGDALQAVETAASIASFRIVAAMPAVLLLVFGAIWLNDKRKGGFKPEKLT